MRFQKGQSGNAKGRRKGTPNKATQEIRDFARSVLEDPKYRASVLRLARKGLLPSHLETALYAYAYGKPTERLEISNPDFVNVAELAGMLNPQEQQIVLAALRRARESRA